MRFAVSVLGTQLVALGTAFLVLKSSVLTDYAFINQAQVEKQQHSIDKKQSKT